MFGEALHNTSSSSGRCDGEGLPTFTRRCREGSVCGFNTETLKTVRRHDGRSGVICCQKLQQDCGLTAQPEMVVTIRCAMNALTAGKYLIGVIMCAIMLSIAC